MVISAPAVCTLACALAAACGDGFSTPSAYDAQPDVCNDPVARDAALEACAAASGCGGIVGYEGTLEARAIRVGAALDSTRAIDTEADGEVFWDVVEGIGSSPYFNFVLKLESVGGALDDELTGRTLTTSRGASSAADPFADDLLGLELRLATSSESQAFAAANGGAVELTSQSADTLEGTFTAAFGEDELAGCFVLTPTSRRRVAAEGDD